MNPRIRLWLLMVMGLLLLLVPSVLGGFLGAPVFRFLWNLVVHDLFHGPGVSYRMAFADCAIATFIIMVWYGARAGRKDGHRGAR